MPVADGYVGSEQGSTVEDVFAIGEKLEPVRIAQLRRRQIGEGPCRVSGDRDEAIPQSDSHVEDVLVVGLFELQPHAGRQVDQVRRTLKNLHRVGVDGALRGGRRRAHEGFLFRHRWLPRKGGRPYVQLPVGSIIWPTTAGQRGNGLLYDASRRMLPTPTAPGA